MQFTIIAAIVLNAATAGKVLGIMASVYAILQLLKKLFPAISGWVAVALNIVLSVIGTVVLVPADQFFSLQTLLTAITAAAGAAGVHGTVQNLGPGAAK